MIQDIELRWLNKQHIDTDEGGNQITYYERVLQWRKLIATAYNPSYPEWTLWQDVPLTEET